MVCVVSRPVFMIPNSRRQYFIKRRKRTGERRFILHGAQTIHDSVTVRFNSSQDREPQQDATSVTCSARSIHATHLLAPRPNTGRIPAEYRPKQGAHPTRDRAADPKGGVATPRSRDVFLIGGRTGGGRGGRARSRWTNTGAEQYWQVAVAGGK
jgi:hypothetical protein